MRNLLLLLALEGHGACALALLQRLLVTTKHLISHLRLLVATCLCLFLHLGDAAIHRFQVFNLQLQVNNLLVTHRIHPSIHMHDVIIVEATQHMEDGIRLTDIRQELIA